MIYKVQRPIATTDPEARWLVYNEDGSEEFEITPGNDLLNVMGDKFKIYAECELLPNGELKLLHVVEDQYW